MTPEKKTQPVDLFAGCHREPPGVFIDEASEAIATRLAVAQGRSIGETIRTALEEAVRRGDKVDAADQDRWTTGMPSGSG